MLRQVVGGPRRGAHQVARCAATAADARSPARDRRCAGSPLPAAPAGARTPPARRQRRGCAAAAREQLRHQRVEALPRQRGQLQVAAAGANAGERRRAARRDRRSRRPPACSRAADAARPAPPRSPVNASALPARGRLRDSPKTCANCSLDLRAMAAQVRRRNRAASAKPIALREQRAFVGIAREAAASAGRRGIAAGARCGAGTRRRRAARRRPIAAAARAPRAPPAPAACRCTRKSGLAAAADDLQRLHDELDFADAARRRA